MSVDGTPEFRTEAPQNPQTDAEREAHQAEVAEQVAALEAAAANPDTAQQEYHARVDTYETRATDLHAQILEQDSGFDVNQIQALRDEITADESLEESHKEELLNYLTRVEENATTVEVGVDVNPDATVSTTDASLETDETETTSELTDEFIDGLEALLTRIDEGIQSFIDTIKAALSGEAVASSTESQESMDENSYTTADIPSGTTLRDLIPGIPEDQYPPCSVNGNTLTYDFTGVRESGGSNLPQSLVINYEGSSPGEVNSESIDDPIFPRSSQPVRVRISTLEGGELAEASDYIENSYEVVEEPEVETEPGLNA